MNSDGHWKTYSNQYMLDFYFIDFKKPPSKYWKKVAIGVDINNNIKELRDIKDKEIEHEQFFKLSGLPRNIFVNTFSNEAKNIEELITKLERINIHRFKILDLEKNIIEVQQDITIKSEILPFTIKKLVGNLTIDNLDKILTLPQQIEGTFNCTNSTFPVKLTVNAKKSIFRNCKLINNVSLENCDEVVINACTGLKDLSSLNLKKEMTKLHVSASYLTSLKGSPNIIHGDFICYSNNLKNLKFGPQVVDGIYNVKLNDLESLEGLATDIGGLLDISINEKDFTKMDIPTTVNIKGKVNY
jgi:hypothetical protein